MCAAIIFIFRVAWPWSRIISSIGFIAFCTWPGVMPIFFSTQPRVHIIWIFRRLLTGPMIAFRSWTILVISKTLPSALLYHFLYGSTPTASFLNAFFASSFSFIFLNSLSLKFFSIFSIVSILPSSFFVIVLYSLIYACLSMHIFNCIS